MSPPGAGPTDGAKRPLVGPDTGAFGPPGLLDANREIGAIGGIEVRLTLDLR
jgi:hypothetical protein